MKPGKPRWLERLEGLLGDADRVWGALMRKLMADLLPVEQFIEMRQRGLSFAEIGRRVGAATSSVKKYGQRVLPMELLKSYKQRVRRCSRCGLVSEPQRPVDKSGLCLWCRLDAAGVNLLRYYRG